MEYSIEMRNITKVFPGIKANDNITLTVKKGEIHSLLGENGAGKSTLMSILFGLYKPDNGEILIKGKSVNVSNPKIANKMGIGMVHQHFQLVENFTALENITLGVDETKLGRLSYSRARAKIQNIMDKYDLHVELDTIVEEMSVGMQQRVEIIKVLFRDNDIIILDEPTSVLTPQQIEKLLDIIKSLSADGKTILFITHKLKEIQAVANRCTVLRKGKCMGTIDVLSTTVEEMAKLMVGRSVIFNVTKTEAIRNDVVLEVKNLKIREDCDPISFNLYGGEILSIAGIEGNGQTQLVELITGLSRIKFGEVILNGKNIEHESVKNHSNAGIAHIPEDRHKHGLVLNDNLQITTIIHQYGDDEFCKHGFLRKKEILEYTNMIIEKYDVRSGKGAFTRVGNMSGGNQQKLIIGRELERSPKLLIAVQPTRGVDVGAIESIHKLIIDFRNSGGAVLLVSLELDEVLDVSDRIIVMYNNTITANILTKDATENSLGLYMSGSLGEACDGYY